MARYAIAVAIGGLAGMFGPFDSVEAARQHAGTALKEVSEVASLFSEMFFERDSDSDSPVRIGGVPGNVLTRNIMSLIFEITELPPDYVFGIDRPGELSLASPHSKH